MAIGVGAVGALLDEVEAEMAVARGEVPAVLLKCSWARFVSSWLARIARVVTPAATKNTAPTAHQIAARGGLLSGDVAGSCLVAIVRVAVWRAAALGEPTTAPSSAPQPRQKRAPGGASLAQRGQRVVMC